MSFANFAIQKTKTETLVVAIRIKEVEDQWYLFEGVQRDFNQHDYLKNNQAAAAMAASMAQGTRRELRLAMSEGLKGVYLDSDSNICFKNVYLPTSGESVDNWLRPPDNSKEGQKNKKVDEIERTLIEVRSAKEAWKLESIEKKLVVGKYDGKSSAATFMSKFESECERFAVVLDGDKVRAFKHFLGDSPLKWYEYKENFLSIDNWMTWKESFLKAFGANGWDQLREAYRFRMKGGSFTDYACRKVKLLIEADPKLQESSLVNQIVIGIPLRYQEKIDRLEVESVDDLMAKLSTFPNLMSNYSSNFGKEDKPKNQSDHQDNKKGGWKQGNWNKFDKNKSKKSDKFSERPAKEVNLTVAESDSSEEETQAETDCESHHSGNE